MGFHQIVWTRELPPLAPRAPLTDAQSQGRQRKHGTLASAQPDFTLTPPAPRPHRRLHFFSLSACQLPKVYYFELLSTITHQHPLYYPFEMSTDMHPTEDEVANTGLPTSRSQQELAKVSRSS